MGDFNYPAIDWEIWNTKGDNVNSIENRFLESIQENFLFQHTTKPTRWRGTDTPHTLDLILTNEEEMINNLEYMSPLGKSDHCVLSFDYNCYINIKNKPRIAKLYDHGNYHDFKLELDKINWQEEIKDDFSVDTNWKYFLTTLNELEQRFVPTKKMTQIGKKKNAFPVDKKTRELIKRKNILSKKIVTNQDPEIRAEYNRVRNKTKSSVNKLKKKFEKGLSENAKANPKAIWSYVKSKSKTREGIGDLHTDPDDTKSPKTDDDKEKAEILSEYFASVFTQEPDDEIPVPNPINIENELTELIINKDMIMKHLKKLKIDKSPGPDKLHPRLLRETMESIAEPLSLIFNQSLNEKTVPKEWKNALVSAIFKKGNKSQAKNYRPVSLTSVVCKILEKIIREHIIKHMKLNRLFSNKQYGFISGRSTSLQLLEVIDKWTEAIDDGYEMSGKKWKKIESQVEEWVAEDDPNLLVLYLPKKGTRNPKPQVIVKGSSRTVGIVNQELVTAFVDSAYSTVPKVPTLMESLPSLDNRILNGNNTIKRHAISNLTQKYNDSTILYSHKNPEVISEKLGKELESCSKWLIDNKLSLHLGKTETILFGSKRKLSKIRNFDVTLLVSSNDLEPSSLNNDITFPKPDNINTLQHGKFLSALDCWKAAQEKSHVFEDAPPGNKSNTWFLVTNADNMSRKTNNRHSKYYDECGIWESSKEKIFHQDYLLSENFQYCTKDSKKRKHDSVITSSDGLFLVVNKAKSIARKAMQRKRLRAERAEKRHL
ncbi:unnamed protein product [Mytilus edulis]|uniref:Endonuclease/exonuclease/phosphatase domain-containing protein n=1 Tax=Mytilus edulis TaxID=6550 RepID=A0A8S3T828_MYTED|nr:unnamed protein product [Mytilus edulis]